MRTWGLGWNLLEARRSCGLRGVRLGTSRGQGAPASQSKAYSEPSEATVASIICTGAAAGQNLPEQASLAPPLRVTSRDSGELPPP